MFQQTLAYFLATNIDRYNHWRRQDQLDVRENLALETLDQLVVNFLPHGSGVDCGTTINIDKSTANRIVLEFAFHHMNEHGYYDGWTEHTCIITPDIRFGIEVRITGKDRNQIKDYLHDLFHYAVNQQITYSFQDGKYIYTDSNNISLTIG